MLSKTIENFQVKSDDRGIVFTRDTCAVLLAIYAACIFIWDYTIAYQAALVVTLGFTLALYRGRLLRLSPYVFTSGLFLLFFLIHTCVGLSNNVRYSTEYLVTLTINLVAVMCILCIIDSPRKIELIMKVLIFTAFAIWIYALIIERKNLFSGMLGAKHATIPKPIFKGRYSHNNLPMFAGYAVLFLSYFRVKHRPLPFTWFLYAFFLICVLMTGARKALLFTMFGMLVYPLMFSKKQERHTNKTIKILGLACCVIIAFYLIMTNEKLYAMIGNRFAGFIAGLLEGEFTESSARSRLVMMNTALASAKQHPLLGIGLNNFRTLDGSFGTWSHNNFLEILVSGGILPLLIYYSFPVYAFIRLVRIRKDPMAGLFLTYMIYIVLHDCLSVSYIGRTTGLMMGLVAAYLEIYDRQTRQRDANFHNNDGIPVGACKE